MRLLLSREQSFSRNAKGLLLRQPLALVDFAGVGRVEDDPEEDETVVKVFRLLCLVKPAQGAMHAQAQVGRLGVALLAMTLFELPI